MSTMSSDSAQYRAMAEAITILRSQIDADNPSQSSIAAAMAGLTQAMAGIF